MIEVVVLLLVTAAVAVIGIRIGMLVAPRLDRWSQPADDEAPGNDDDS